MRETCEILKADKEMFIRWLKKNEGWTITPSLIEKAKREL
jgi:hypothetical protein